MEFQILDHYDMSVAVRKRVHSWMCTCYMGSFNNYLTKMRWVGGPKIAIFVHVKDNKSEINDRVQ